MKRGRRRARYRSVDLSRPHDKYFRRVFSNRADAASLLRAYVPEAVARTLQWATLTLLPGRFVSSDWHDSESDLLFSVEQEPDAAPVQAQQSPDSVPGALGARLAQVAMMAAFREGREELLESATRLIGKLYRAMGFDAVAKHVEYVLLEGEVVVMSPIGNRHAASAV